MKTIENNSRHELTDPQWIIDRTPYAKGKKEVDQWPTKVKC
jgi:hypothetical protein